MSFRPTVMEQRRAEDGLCIRQCDIGDASPLAALHVENLSGRLGQALTEAYYQACLASRQHLFVCAEHNAAVVGFIGMVCDRAKIIKFLLATQAFAALRYTVSNPSLLGECGRHVWRWRRIRNFSRKAELPEWEYRPVVVAKPYRSRGIAKLLLTAADHVLDRKGVTKVFLQVANTNVAALRAYERSGFQIRLEYSSTIFMTKNLASENSLK